MKNNFNKRQLERKAKHERKRKKERKICKGLSEEAYSQRKEKIKQRIKNLETQAKYRKIEKKNHDK